MSKELIKKKYKKDFKDLKRVFAGELKRLVELYEVSVGNKKRTKREFISIVSFNSACHAVWAMEEKDKKRK